MAAYSIGYPTTIVQAYIHLLSSQCLPHPLFGQFFFILTSLHLESLGPKFLTLHGPSPSLFLTLCLFLAILAACSRARLQFLLRIVLYCQRVESQFITTSTYDFVYQMRSISKSGVLILTGRDCDPRGVEVEWISGLAHSASRRTILLRMPQQVTGR